MSAAVKLSAAKAERIRELAEQLAAAARKYDEDKVTVRRSRARAEREAARDALIRECETPEDA